MLRGIIEEINSVLPLLLASSILELISRKTISGSVIQFRRNHLIRLQLFALDLIQHLAELLLLAPWMEPARSLPAIMRTSTKIAQAHSETLLDTEIPYFRLQAMAGLINCHSPPLEILFATSLMTVSLILPTLANAVTVNKK